MQTHPGKPSTASNPMHYAADFPPETLEEGRLALTERVAEVGRASGLDLASVVD